MAELYAQRAITRITYPWKKMNIGDYFFTKKKYKNIYSAIQNAQKRHGIKISCRQTEKGLMVERVG